MCVSGSMSEKLGMLGGQKFFLDFFYIEKRKLVTRSNIEHLSQNIAQIF